MATYTIPAKNLYSLQKEVEKLNRRCVKLGVTPVVFNVLERGIMEVPYCGTWKAAEKEGTLVTNHENVKADDRYAHMPKVAVDSVTVEVIGDAPRANGWYFIVSIVITDAGNVFKTMTSDYQIPEHYRTTETFECDHCKTNRRRTSFYLVHNPDSTEWKMVGRTCLKDFTGHENPENIARAAELLNLIHKTVEASSEWDPDDPAMRCRRGIRGYGLRDVLAASSLVIERDGFISRTKAREEGYFQATADIVINYMNPLNDRTSDRYGTPSDKNRAEAEAALEWAATLDVDSSNDYLWNLRTVAHCPLIDERLMGLAVSMISAYHRAMAKKAEEEARAKLVDEYYGTIGERTTFTGTVTRVVEYETGFGIKNILIIIVDGRTLVWRTGNGHMGEEGQTFKIKATIKAHSEYKGRKQTEIQRAVLDGIPAAPQPVAA